MGQRVSRHADRPYVYIFFVHPQFLKTILASPHWLLPLYTKPNPSAKAKESILLAHKWKLRELKT